MSDPKKVEQRFPVENGERPLGSLPDASTWLERVAEFGHLTQRGGEGSDE